MRGAAGNAEWRSVISADCVTPHPSSPQRATIPDLTESPGLHVVGAVHANTIEGFWSIFKRGVVGTFHKVSRKYLPLSVAEFQFRYNSRMNTGIFGAAVAGV